LAEPPPNEKSSNLWEIRVDGHTGKAAGEPKKITNWAGFLIATPSITVDGRHLTLAHRSYQNIVLVGELEANQTQLRAPRRLILDEANNWPFDWTADSKAVIFLSDRNGTPGIFKLAPDQESAEAEPILAGPGDMGDPRLSPDGAWVVYSSMPTDLERTAPGFVAHLMRVPVSGGPPEPVMDSPGWFYHSCSVRAGGPCVVAERTPDCKQLVFTAFDPIKGRGQELARMNTDPSRHFYGWNLSPDGSKLAVLTDAKQENQIRIFSLPGGESHDLTVEGWSGFNIVNWSADGKAMILSARSPHGTTLVYVDLEGHAHPLWEQTGRLMKAGNSHADPIALLKSKLRTISCETRLSLPLLLLDFHSGMVSNVEPSGCYRHSLGSSSASEPKTRKLIQGKLE
jgi:WD40-like Beta Propeller Repeat